MTRLPSPTADGHQEVQTQQHGHLADQEDAVRLKATRRPVTTTALGLLALARTHVRVLTTLIELWRTDMKRNAIIAAGVVALLAALVVCASLISKPKKGVVETLAKLQEEQIGAVYVLGRYDGFLNGWDVAFFHRNRESQWLGYYLAHESRHWKQPNLQVEGTLVIVNDGDKRVAEYDTQTGMFTNKLQGVAYSKKDGLDGGIEVAKWSLTDLQQPK